MPLWKQRAMIDAPRSDFRQSATLKTWAGFIMMYVGIFIAILDVHVVAAPLPTILNALTIS